MFISNFFIYPYWWRRKYDHIFVTALKWSSWLLSELSSNYALQGCFHFNSSKIPHLVQTFFFSFFILFVIGSFQTSSFKYFYVLLFRCDFMRWFSDEKEEKQSEEWTKIVFPNNLLWIVEDIRKFKTSLTFNTPEKF